MTTTKMTRKKKGFIVLIILIAVLVLTALYLSYSYMMASSYCPQAFIMEVDVQNNSKNYTLTFNSYYKNSTLPGLPLKDVSIYISDSNYTILYNSTLADISDNPACNLTFMDTDKSNTLSDGDILVVHGHSINPKSDLSFVEDRHKMEITVLWKTEGN